MNQNSFKTFKERGEWVELCFMTRALEHGYKISKPWGDSAPYKPVLSGVEGSASPTAPTFSASRACPERAIANRMGQVHHRPHRHRILLPVQAALPQKAGLHSPAGRPLRRLHHSPGRLVSHPRRHPPPPAAQNRTHALPDGPAQKRLLQIRSLQRSVAAALQKQTCISGEVSLAGSPQFCHPERSRGILWFAATLSFRSAALSRESMLWILYYLSKLSFRQGAKR